MVSTAVIIFMLFISACTAYRLPYLSVDLKSTPYTSSNIKVNYTYVCEDRDQRCVCILYDVSNPSKVLYKVDEILPSTGELDFSKLGLVEGDYRLDFSIYSENEGEYYLLKYLDESYEFSIDFP